MVGYLSYAAQLETGRREPAVWERGWRGIEWGMTTVRIS